MSCRTTFLIMLALLLWPAGLFAQERPRKEPPSVEETFARHDRNGDGKLTADELTGRRARLLEKADENGDGAVTKEELQSHYDRRGSGRRGEKGERGEGRGDRPPRGERQRKDPLPEPSSDTRALSGEGKSGMVRIAGGEFEMGDHHDLGGKEHPSDEVPLHLVFVDSFSISATEVTNREYVAFLNAAKVSVKDGLVRDASGRTVYCDTRESDPASRIEIDGRGFAVTSGKEDHPATGIRWHGAAAYTNWLSVEKGHSALYDPETWTCDIGKPGYRLPTEAEWEFAARGGSHPPYLVFPWGNEIDPRRANLPRSGDPFESGPVPHTTPVGFFDGSVRRKADFGWPGKAETFATENGANGYGLYDMAGNVWEWCHDWYGRDAYASAAEANPVGPARGTRMPDGRRYRVMRGGNWYNGDDGHARTANRNNGYYRGPDDPDHSFYHVGFRVVLAGPVEETPADPKVGLLLSTEEAAPGYTLFAPKHNTVTYLMDNEGRVVNEWKSKYEPGQSVYLLPNGNLLHACFTKAKGFIHGGEGGRLEEYDWDGNLVWEFDYVSDRHLSHHDVEPLENGNVLLLAVERKTREECIAAGFDPQKLRDGELFPDSVVEVRKTGRSSGEVVWEWHVWDHLIQGRDRSKGNFGDPAAHPERIDISGTDRRRFPGFWNHMNSIDYHPGFDQILLSVRGNHEVWVIDHSTTTRESAGSSGGRHGKGGDLLYRWGNPAQYRAGTSRNQQLFDQHDARWIPPGSPGAGNILIFNNGNQRGWSSVVEIVPPVDGKGRYRLARAKAFGPAEPTWEYAPGDRKSLYSEAISGAQRLENGNTLICDGVHGVLFEVTPAGKTVWKYINPVVRDRALSAGETPGLDDRGHQWNAVFKIDRYSPDFAGFADRDMTPKGPLTGSAQAARPEPRGTAPAPERERNRDRPPRRERDQGRERGPRGSDRDESGPRRPWLAVHLEEIDADGDGKLTREEALAHAEQTFAAYDRDQDGKIDAGERDAGNGPRLAMGGFVRKHAEQLDSDRNGSISEEELLSTMRRMFEQADRDRDGTLEAAEFESGGREAGGRRPDEETRKPERSQGTFHTEVPDHPVDIVLGRPTENSIVVSVLAHVNLTGHVEYGRAGDERMRRTKTVKFAGGEPAEIVLTGLEADTAYRYRLRAEWVGTSTLLTTPLRSFHTPRARGSAFTFTIQADSHLDENTSPELYAKTLANAAKDAPDFHVDLGDTFMTDERSDHREAAAQYLAQRYYFGLLCHSAPLFLVLGNHDGEKGGTRERERTEWSAGMREQYFPSPSSDGYYAFEWGDALIVVLDPFRHSERGRGSDQDGWGMTLGETQYRWLASTLEGSRAPLKFVFIHNLVGGSNTESGKGRGGAEASVFFEWGGKNADGTDGFAEHRPGWAMPIHDLLIEHGVAAVFRGHDHFYARQERDGIVYQLVPQPGAPRARADRLAKEHGYVEGKILSGAGHLRVRVEGARAIVDFVAAEDGKVVFGYEIGGRTE